MATSVVHPRAPESGARTVTLSGEAMFSVAPDSTRYEGFSMCVGAGLALLLLNVLFRFGAAGDRERDREAAAREYFTAHGHWPDERPPERRG